ncbi:MAG: deoxyhypusine synthase, partial [Bacteroidetes bacterium]|nr:deoxyhypusine synthase [Bacteroidota bacterium]
MARKLEKKDLLKNVVKHIDIKKYDSTEIISARGEMSFTSRESARAAD